MRLLRWIESHRHGPLGAAITAGAVLFGGAWTILEAAGVQGNRYTILSLLLVSAAVSVAAYVAILHRKLVPSEKHNVLQRIRASGVIRIGFFHYPPLIEYHESAGNVHPTGLYADILRHLATKNSLKIDWRPLKLSEAMDAVSHHRVDCYACIMLSDVRYRECDFVGLLHSIAVVGVVRRDDTSVKHPWNLGSRRDLKVAVCEGEIGHHTARTTLRLLPRQLIEVNSIDICAIVSQVRDGHAQVALADALSCKRMMKVGRASKELKLVFSDPPILTVPNGFMIAKNEEDLSEWLDAEIRSSFSQLTDRSQTRHCEKSSAHQFLG